MSLQEKVERVLHNQPGHFGVSIKHSLTGEGVNIHGEQLFQMASVFKIPILMALYKDAYTGKRNLSERIRINREDQVPGSGVIKELDEGVELTLKDLATLMIIVSDNIATDQLYHLLGKEYIEETVHDLGLKDLMIHHSCWELLSLSVGLEPEPFSEERLEEINQRLFSGEYFTKDVFQVHLPNNVCTPLEMTRLLEILLKGEFVSKDCSEAILDVMKRQQLSQRIPGRLPLGTKVAHKTGSIASAINDAGIVYLPDGKGAFIISVFSVDNATRYEGEALVAKIAQTAYEYFIETETS